MTPQRKAFTRYQREVQAGLLVLETVSHGAVRFGMLIANHLNETDRTAHPSVDAIAAMLDRSRNMADKYRDELKAAGVLTWDRTGPGGTCRYRFDLDALHISSKASVGRVEGAREAMSERNAARYARRDESLSPDHFGIENSCQGYGA